MAFEVFTTVIVAFLYREMGLVSKKAAERAAYIAVMLLFLTATTGVGHNFYWIAKPTKNKEIKFDDTILLAIWQQTKYVKIWYDEILIFWKYMVLILLWWVLFCMGETAKWQQIKDM